MSSDEIKRLKQRRDSLSCKLSTMRREVENPNFNQNRISSKISKGIELSKEFQEITSKLLDAGCNLNSKAPYLFPHWWSSIDKSEKLTSTQPQTSAKIQEYKPICEKLDLNSIKNALKEVINELNLGRKENTYNYNIHLAWTSDINIDIDTLSKYLIGMGLGLQYSDIDDVRGEYMHKYSIVCTEIEYKCIIKSAQLIINTFGIDNVEIFGKKC